MSTSCTALPQSRFRWPLLFTFKIKLLLLLSVFQPIVAGAASNDMEIESTPLELRVKWDLFSYGVAWRSSLNPDSKYCRGSWYIQLSEPLTCSLSGAAIDANKLLFYPLGHSKKCKLTQQSDNLQPDPIPANSYVIAGSRRTLGSVKAYAPIFREDESGNPLCGSCEALPLVTVGDLRTKVDCLMGMHHLQESLFCQIIKHNEYLGVNGDGHSIDPKNLLLSWIVNPPVKNNIRTFHEIIPKSNEQEIYGKIKPKADLGLHFNLNYTKWVLEDMIYYENQLKYIYNMAGESLTEEQQAYVTNINQVMCPSNSLESGFRKLDFRSDEKEIHPISHGVHLYDWDQTYWKGNCIGSEFLTGVEFDATNNKGLIVVCKKGIHQFDLNYQITQKFPDKSFRLGVKNADKINDWDEGYIKNECNLHERMIGISQENNNMSVHAILCGGKSTAKQTSNPLLVDRKNHCITIPFLQPEQVNRQTTNANILLSAFCPTGFVVSGISTDRLSHEPHRLLCCSESNSLFQQTRAGEHEFVDTEQRDYSIANMIGESSIASFLGSAEEDIPDWDRNYWKGTCGKYQIMIGVSRTENRLSKVLCQDAKLPKDLHIDLSTFIHHPNKDESRCHPVRPFLADDLDEHERQILLKTTKKSAYYNCHYPASLNVTFSKERVDPMYHDWHYTYDKYQCDYPEFLIGISQQVVLTDEMKSGFHGVQCAKVAPSTAPQEQSTMDCQQVLFAKDNPSEPSIGDWDQNNDKAECPIGYHVVGISASTGGIIQVKSILCCNSIGMRIELDGEEDNCTSNTF